jgi:hypothetical protein
VSKKSPTNEQRMLARLERARDEANLSEAEAREVLREDGVDVEVEFKLLLDGISARHEAERKQRLSDAENAYRAINSGTTATTRRNRNENLARIRAYQVRHPELNASFRDLTHMSDDDLQSLGDEIDELANDGDDGEEE